MADNRLHSKRKDLEELSQLGHFLKGSSATLGFTKVKDECEKIQHYGHKKNATGEEDEPDEEKCLRLIGGSLRDAKAAHKVVDALMKEFYKDT
jgi:osomolarity two-component system, phosphorelay intermediate protein YPD1